MCNYFSLNLHFKMRRAFKKGNTIPTMKNLKPYFWMLYNIRAVGKAVQDPLKVLTTRKQRKRAWEEGGEPINITPWDERMDSLYCKL